MLAKTCVAAFTGLCVSWSMAASGAITIETVHVGNSGNPADTRYDPAGHGAVAYEYNISKYEITAGQYTAFLNAVAKSDPYELYDYNMNPMYAPDDQHIIYRGGSSGNYFYQTRSGWGNRSIMYITWGDAARFVNWLHNGQPTGVQDLSTTEDGAYYLNGAMTADELLAVTREPDAKWALPNEDEWYKSAYHKNDGVTGNYFNYPTSYDTPPYPSNEPAFLYVPGNYANVAGYPNNGLYLGVTEVGHFRRTTSPYGTFDQCGNVLEWCETILPDSTRAVLGASHSTIIDRAPLASERNGYNPTYNFGGIRVVQVPEPASMTMLALGGVCMLTRRRGVPQ